MKENRFMILEYVYSPLAYVLTKYQAMRDLPLPLCAEGRSNPTQSLAQKPNKHTWVQPRKRHLART